MVVEDSDDRNVKKASEHEDWVVPSTLFSKLILEKTVFIKCFFLSEIFGVSYIAYKKC